jgi:hypothetical protein
MSVNPELDHWSGSGMVAEPWTRRLWMHLEGFSSGSEHVVRNIVSIHWFWGPTGSNSNACITMLRARAYLHTPVHPLSLLIYWWVISIATEVFTSDLSVRLTYSYIHTNYSGPCAIWFSTACLRAYRYSI